MAGNTRKKRKRWFDRSSDERNKPRPEQIKKTSGYMGHAAANAALSAMKPDELKRIGASPPTYEKESTDWPAIVEAVSKISRKVFV